MAFLFVISFEFCVSVSQQENNWNSSADSNEEIKNNKDAKNWTKNERRARQNPLNNVIINLQT